MNNDSPAKAILVVLGTAFVCSLLVTVAAVKLQPIQRAYQDLERNRFVVAISGLAESDRELSDADIVEIFQDLDVRLVDLDAGKFDQSMNPLTFDQRQSVSDPERSVTIPSDFDVASLGRRSRLAKVYIVGDAQSPERIILPMHGQGMWSTIYGYLALDSDLNSIAAVVFYEQGETAGIGDKILESAWQSGWRGQTLFDAGGGLAFRVADGAAATPHDVDAIAGATLTTNAVTTMVRYWFGPHGFGPFLDNLRTGNAGP